MSPIPTEKTELEHFTPKCMENIEPKIVFRLRPATERDTQRFQHMLALEGLRLFTNDDIRKEILRVLEENWDAETFETQSQRLNSFWAATDQDIEVSQSEAAAVAELTARCMDNSSLLRRMDADNQAFHRAAPSVALSLFLAGWTNLDVPFRLEAGYVPLNTLRTLCAELHKVETEAEKNKVEGANPGLGYLQLTYKAYELLSLTKDEEKNSSAPSPSSEIQSGLPTTTPQDGASETTTSKPKRTRQTKSKRGQPA